MIHRKMKHILTVLVTGVMLCGCLILNGETMQVNAADGGQTAAEKEETYTEDLQFLTYCDMDELRIWNDPMVVLTEAETQEMKQYMETNIISGAKNDYEKASMIFDWIVHNVEYAWDTNIMISANPYFVFKNRIAVCGGYSNLYKAMLNMANIPAVVITGDTPAGGHAWNAVYADDRWFYADSTWGASYGGGFFDEGIAHFSEEHTTTRLEYVSIETADGLLIGYDQGISVIGVNPGITTVNVPETFEEFKITSVSYMIFSYAYNVKELNLSKNVTALDTQVTSASLESITADEENPMYASKDGVLFTKDYSDILIYPKKKTDDTFVLPKETTAFDEKETFTNVYLKKLEVEEGNSKYTSYDGALYNSDKTELLVVPAGKTEIRILDSASISGMAFANSDTSAITIYAKPDSPAHQYAVANNIRFVASEEETPKPAVSVTEAFSDVQKGKWYVENVQYVYDNGLMSGNDGVFNPLGIVTRAQVVTTLYRLAGSPKVTDYSACEELSDVEKGKWYTEAICWAYSTGVTTGNTSTMTFNVSAPVTRQQLAAFFYRYADYAGYDITATADISSMLNADQVSAYAVENIKWAVGTGLISGSQIEDVNGNVAYDLKPQAGATRVQLAAILQRFCEGNNI